MCPPNGDAKKKNHLFILALYDAREKTRKAKMRPHPVTWTDKKKAGSGDGLGLDRWIREKNHKNKVLKLW